ncbi:MFS transporter [Ferrovibrio sp.]|uniref:MFS transporter n=1 Tax=Ferrovibrio sp. TaxID=1917215 RepID=UPI00261B258D|nr:MFS transporter [Ferrovibrio sp.]
MVAAAPQTDSLNKAGHGWPLVGALSFAQLVSWGSIYYAFSLFVVPMEADLGWSRTALNGALSLGLLTAGLVAYPVGKLIDARGGRLLMSAGSLLAALLFVAWAYVQHVAVFYAIWFGLGICMALTLYEPVFVVLTRLFPENYRFRITMLTLVGGFASTAFIPLTAWWIEALGWRDALFVLAACNLLYCLPVHLLMLRDKAGGASTDTAVAETGDSPMRRALRHPVFWGLVVCFTFYYATFSALTFHFIPMFDERGFTLALAVGVIAVIGPAQVAGRIILLLFGRRLSAATTGRIIVLMFPLSVILLILFPGSVTALFAFAAIYGCANGIMTIVRGTAVPDLLWREGYGAISGALTLPANIAKALAPSIAAFVWAAFGNYGPVLWVILVGALISAAGFWLAAAKSKTPAG